MNNSRSNRRRQYYCSSQVPPYYTYIVQGVPQNMYNNVPQHYPNDLENNGQFDLSQQQQQFYLAPISDERFMPMQYIQSESQVQPQPQPLLQSLSQQRHLPDNEESDHVDETPNADQIEFGGQPNCRQPKHENEFDSNRFTILFPNSSKQIVFLVATNQGKCDFHSSYICPRS